MKKPIALVALLTLGVSAIAAQTFTLKIENLGPQGLSPLFWSVGDDTFDIFQLDGTASSGIKAIAEGGNTAPMSAIAAAAGSSVFQYGTIAGGPVGPGGSRTVMFQADAAHKYLSFASMLGMTNDGFIGESVSSSSLSLFGPEGARGFSLTIKGLRAWDAGTELNTQNAADLGFLGGSGNPADNDTAIRMHDSILSGVGNSWSMQPDWNLDTDLARITVTPVPEPASLSALAIGIGAILRRRQKPNDRG